MARLDSDKRDVLDYILENNDLPDDTVYLENYSYDTAIVGISQDGRLIYSYDKMVDWLTVNTDMSLEEAVEWLEYNTLGVCGGEGMPIILYSLDGTEE